MEHFQKHNYIKDTDTSCKLHLFYAHILPCIWLCKGNVHVFDLPTQMFVRKVDACVYLNTIVNTF